MWQQLLQVTGSKILSSGLAFVYSAVVARRLGPAEYGMLSFSFAVTAVASELTGYGLETALVRIAAPESHRGGSAHPEYGVVFKLKLLVNSAVAVLGLLAAGPLSTLLGEPGYRLPIQLGALGALGFSLWRLSLALLQAFQAFGRYAIVQSANGIFKIAGLLILLLFARIDLPLVLTVHVSSFFLGFFVGAMLLPRGTLSLRLYEDRQAWRAVVGYAKWIVASSFLSILNSWLGILVIGYYLTADAVGQYAAAYTLIRALEILIVSLDTVLLPIACRVTEPTEGREYLKKAFAASSMLSAAILPLFLLAGPAIVLLYSPAFESCTPVFRILFFGSLVTLNVHPVLLILYAKNRPELMAALEGLSLVLTAIGYVLLIPRLAIAGAAVADTFARVVADVVGVAIVYRLLKSS